MSEARVRREQIAYDQGQVFYESTRLQQRFHHVFNCPNSKRGKLLFESWLRTKTAEAVVLDYGCLDGVLAPKYREYGAKRVIGIDISQNGIASARQKFGHIGEFFVCDAHQLDPIASESIDLVVGKAILHHLRFEVAIAQVKRVLRPGGTALFVEPLRDNPLSKLFRMLTPKARTSDELPLSRQQLVWAASQFSSEDHYYANLMSTPLAMATSLTNLTPDNWLLRAADQVDEFLGRTSMKYWMRTVYLRWTK